MRGDLTKPRSIARQILTNPVSIGGDQGMGGGGWEDPCQTLTTSGWGAEEEAVACRAGLGVEVPPA